MAYINGTLPIGSVVPYGGKELPSNFLWCDGTKYKVGDYIELFKVINHYYDNQPIISIDGNTFDDINLVESYFAVPDLRGRVPVGGGVGKEYPSNKRMLDDSANGNDLETLLHGYYGGENKHTLTANEVADHIHYFINWSFSEAWGNIKTNALGQNIDRWAGQDGGQDWDNWPYGSERWMNVTLLQGATHRPDLEDKNLQPTNNAHNNMQAYCVVNYIIRAY